MATFRIDIKKEGENVLVCAAYQIISDFSTPAGLSGYWAKIFNEARIPLLYAERARSITSTTSELLRE